MSASSTVTMKEVDLLLVGKTGTGKSSVGNSILKKQAFKTSSSLVSATVGVAFEFSEYKNYSIEVTDTQGYGDTRLTSKEKVEDLCKCITMAMKANDGKGFHAVIVTLRFGNRLTDEERDAITAIKRIFPGVMSTHGILLMTGGDMFEMERKKSGVVFQNWVHQQGKDFKDLLEEFGGRIVLFDNNTENEAEKNAQIDRLLEMIDSLPSFGERYTNILFQAAAAELLKSKDESQDFIIDRTTLRSTSVLMDKFEDCRRIDEQEDGADRKVLLEEWNRLLWRCDQLIEQIENRGEREMTGVEYRVVAMRKTIQEYIDAKKNHKEEEAKYRAMVAAQQRLYQEYVRSKILTVGLIVGGTVLGVGALAATIALIVLYPSSLTILLRVARALLPLLRHSIPYVLTPLASVFIQLYRTMRQGQDKK
ncbi:hypothetical protein EGW08_014467 [Elysia chlorotica]|uniref:AIG1-type G domain-containing protein n=1 Tax=Elysia chlorotica TaxID=188477 RepID=A0A433T847_ELYCH|nr:hypothetical protein EGW08_014467 [Elysia chlorotica]